MTWFELYPESEMERTYDRETVLAILDQYVSMMNERYQSLRQSIEIDRGEDVLLVEYSDYAAMLWNVLRYGEMYYRRLTGVEQESTNG